MIRVRVERPGDEPAIREVETAAFGRSEEADLVDALRASGGAYRSWVAASGSDLVAHVVFTPVRIDGWAVPGMGLGPVAVVPERQRTGVGSRLIHHAMATLRAEGCPYVALVGHPTYYPRFGFVPGVRFALAAPWPGIPDDVFLVRAFDPRALPRAGGVVRFLDAFDAAM